jgi:hypothetical protein
MAGSFQKARENAGFAFLLYAVGTLPNQIDLAGILLREILPVAVVDCS